MSDHSRRTFLKSASLGAAAVGTAAVVPAFASPADASPASDHVAEREAASGPAHAGPFTVWVKDADKGVITVLVGESEVVHTDRELAKRLARIAAGAQS